MLLDDPQVIIALWRRMDKSSLFSFVEVFHRNVIG